MHLSAHTLRAPALHVRVATAASMGAIIVGSLVLLGWIFDIELLKRVFPNLVAMNPTTAIALMILGTSLWLSESKDVGGRTRYIIRGGAALVALAGLLKLCDMLFGWGIGVDHMFFRDKLRVDQTGQTNSMAPNTALNLVLLACALLFLDTQARRGRYTVQVFLIVSLLASLLAIIGYLYGVRIFYGIGSFIPMALHTAVTFVVLAIGILFARPEYGLMRIALDKGVSGDLVRRLLPMVVGLPILMGWLRLAGQRIGLYEHELGVALMVVGNILLLTLLVWWSSFLLFRSDRQRQQAEAQLRNLTLTDELTALRNRRGFLLLTEQALKQVQQKRTALHVWLLFADLDGLKQINDGLGHEVGSTAIVQAAEILKATFRDSDIIARFGGDEFAILAIGNEANGGSVMVARLHDNIGVFNMMNQLPYRLSLSVGMVHVDPDTVVSLDELITEADHAMYAHKRSKKGIKV